MNRTEHDHNSGVLSFFSLWLPHPVFNLINFPEVSNDYFLSLTSVFFIILLLHVTLSVFIYTIVSNLEDDSRNVRVLFVIAHPDDECMFFGPTIIKLKETCNIHLLCLSIGDHLNKGSVRKSELHASCKVLGIPSSNITVMSCSGMPDDPKTVWDDKQLCRILLNHIESMDFNEVYTFDSGGVSGHSNHISIFNGFVRMLSINKVPAYCKIFLLDSVNTLRKYSGFLDVYFSLPIFSKHRLFIIPFKESCTVREAMKQHRSQMVWFRWLYIYLSRYLYMNTYKELKLLMNLYNN